MKAGPFDLMATAVVEVTLKDPSVILKGMAACSKGEGIVSPEIAREGVDPATGRHNRLVGFEVLAFPVDGEWLSAVFERSSPCLSMGLICLMPFRALGVD